MPWVARVGQKLTARRLNSNYINTIVSTSDTVVTAGSSNTLVSGTDITITTLDDNVRWWAIAFCDVDGVGSGTVSVATVDLMLESVAQSGQAIYQATAASANARSTVGQTWDGTLTTPDTYTFQLRATMPSGGLQLQTTHTKLQITTHGYVEL